MKVNIGPYPTHRWYHNYLYKWFGYSPQQKVSVRIDRWDTWSMDATLAEIILPMLIQLKETKHGIPFTYREDAPADPQYDDIEEDNGFSGARWGYIIDEMIFAFSAKNTDWEDQFYSGEMDHIDVPVDKDGDRVTGENDPDFFGYRWDEGPNHTFSVDREGMQAFHDRMQNGFRLFGRYYSALWD